MVTVEEDIPDNTEEILEQTESTDPEKLEEPETPVDVDSKVEVEENDIPDNSEVILDLTELTESEELEEPESPSDNKVNVEEEEDIPDSSEEILDKTELTEPEKLEEPETGSSGDKKVQIAKDILDNKVNVVEEDIPGPSVTSEREIEVEPEPALAVSKEEEKEPFLPLETITSIPSYCDLIRDVQISADRRNFSNQVQADCDFVPSSYLSSVVRVRETARSKKTKEKSKPESSPKTESVPEAPGAKQETIKKPQLHNKKSIEVPAVAEKETKTKPVVVDGGGGEPAVKRADKISSKKAKAVSREHSVRTKSSQESQESQKKPRKSPSSPKSKSSQEDCKSEPSLPKIIVC